MKNVIIPISFVLETDDVGWDDGRDLRLNGKASRSGFPRNHTFNDYDVLRRITEATGKSLAVAIVVGDWDKDNLLRGAVGYTHDPYGWDRASEIDIAATRKYIDLLESSNIDFMVHGMLHGRYDEEGKMINEHEYLLFDEVEGKDVARLPSEEDFEARLDMFFKICNSWGIKKEFRGFVNPGGTVYSDDELLDRMTKVMYKYGIRYWADPFISWGEDEGPLKIFNGVACFRWKRNRTGMPWDAYDIDPDTLKTINGQEEKKKSCLHGSHWTNLLRYNSEHNFDYIPGWVRFYERQGEVFGSMNAANLAEAVNQTFYHQFAKISDDDGALTVDLSEVEKNKLDCHKDEFFISVKHGIAPQKCEGGEISLYEEHGEFDTYKITHTKNTVKIYLK